MTLRFRRKKKEDSKQTEAESGDENGRSGCKVRKVEDEKERAMWGTFGTDRKKLESMRG